METEKNKPYWALIETCNKMAEQLAGLEAVVIGTDNEVDQFDNRDGRDRLPLLSGRIEVRVKYPSIILPTPPNSLHLLLCDSLRSSFGSP